MLDLPQDFLEEMKNLLKGEYEDFLDSYKHIPMNGLRINTRKCSAKEAPGFLPFQLKQVPWIENGYYYEESIPSKHPYYFAGLYYLQEPSAMTPASLLPVQEGDKVLDLCAAPGGKATELGARLKGTGMLLANDISNSRAKALLKNLELFGIPNIYVTSEEPGKLLLSYREYFDKILIDAPCSGEGMFRKDPHMLQSYKEHGPEYYAAIQKDIILKAADMLKPGGMMLYSTCTFSAKEDEETIEYLLSERKDMQIVDPKRYEGFGCGLKDGLEKCVRIWPHRMEGEGHFAALLYKEKQPEEAAADAVRIPVKEIIDRKKKKDKKKNNLPAKGKRKPAAEPDPIAVASEFLKDVTLPLKGDFYENEGKIYLLPEETQVMPSVRYLRTGLLLGEVTGGRFEPSQALAMALRGEDYPNVCSFSVDDERVIRYLKGETILLSDEEEKTLASGFCLVTVQGYPLGWAKMAAGQLKNKYYPGWRWQS